jgi:hypothetical protein
MPTIRSRPALTSAAGLLFAATLIIVVDVRIAAFDVVADVIGGVMVLVATLRIHGALRGADTMRSTLVALAVIALPVTVVETLQPTSGFMALLAASQMLGALVLARLLADALRASEPGLAATWNGTFQLIAIVGVVPFVVGTALGAFASGTTNVSIQSPLALVLVVLLFIPLIALLRALWRTSRDPLQSPTPAT